MTMTPGSGLIPKEHHSKPRPHRGSSVSTFQPGNFRAAVLPLKRQRSKSAASPGGMAPNREYRETTKP